MAQSLKTSTAKINWLTSEKQSAETLLSSYQNSWQEIPLPANVGKGGYESWELANGIMLFRSRYTFEPDAKGQIIPLASANFKFDEPKFLVQTIAQGRSIQIDPALPYNLIYGEGVDLFRYGQNFSMTPSLDTTQDIQMTLLMIGREGLVTLLGEPLFNRLITALDLNKSPNVVTKAIPNFVNQRLHKSMLGEYTGELKKLLAHAMVLEYLSLLIEYVSGNRKAPQRKKPSSKTPQKLHEYLINLEGKLPTLNAIAAKFGRSTRSLNDDFKAVYGESISVFILNYRLEEAHDAIKNSTVPLKTISTKLGYSHVNHFNNAFKNKFGYSPGSLRR